jgi:uncharacterized protein with HEPN domain
VTTAAKRAQHIKDAIGEIRGGLKGMPLEVARASGLQWSGFLYELLIISEASRHLPEDWKSTFGAGIEWRPLADLGNRLRHSYQHNEAVILWSIYLNDLDPLEAAIDRMLAAHGED